MTREETVLVFDTLKASRATLFCMGRLWGWTVAIRGRIVSSTRDEAVIVSSDRRSGSVSIRWDTEDLLIRFADPHEIPLLEARGAREGSWINLAVSLPLRLRPADIRNRVLEAPPREMLFLYELPPE